MSSPTPLQRVLWYGPGADPARSGNSVPGLHWLHHQRLRRIDDAGRHVPRFQVRAPGRLHGRADRAGTVPKQPRCLALSPADGVRLDLRLRPLYWSLEQPANGEPSLTPRGNERTSSVPVVTAPELCQSRGEETTWMEEARVPRRADGSSSSLVQVAIMSRASGYGRFWVCVMVVRD